MTEALHTGQIPSAQKEVSKFQFLGLMIIVIFQKETESMKK